jgi:hypothetical protein
MHDVAVSKHLWYIPVCSESIKTIIVSGYNGIKILNNYTD